MYTGYNALSMALAMPENGTVVACEIEDTYIEIAKPFFKEVRQCLSKQLDLYWGIHKDSVHWRQNNTKMRIFAWIHTSTPMHNVQVLEPVQCLNLAFCKFVKMLLQSEQNCATNSRLYCTSIFCHYVFTKCCRLQSKKVSAKETVSHKDAKPSSKINSCLNLP